MCCFCEPSCFGKDQRSAIIQFCLFFALRFCWGSPSIRYQPCAKSEPTVEYSWCDYKGNNKFTLQKICLGISEKENQTSQQIQNQSAWVEYSSRSFKRTEEKVFPESNSVCHSIRFGHWPNCSFRWRFDGRRGTRRWLYALYWAFLWIPQWRKLDTLCETCQVGAHTQCAGMQEDFVCEAFQG